MSNPFVDFKAYPFKKREIPLDRIIAVKRKTMEQIINGYLELSEREVKEMVWLVEHSRIVKAYSAALESVKELEYDSDDIEEFCTELDKGGKIPYLISGPAGIYVSALCNNVGDAEIHLKLYELKRTFHFLGYRLPEGKTLVLEGNVGDFVGTGLSGGKLIVEGSTGNWTGAGMVKGELSVKNHAGQNTGEWMKGGVIRVGGHIRGIGKSISGGYIYQREKLLFPSAQKTDG
jgi:hypothetical protein